MKIIAPNWCLISECERWKTSPLNPNNQSSYLVLPSGGGVEDFNLMVGKVDIVGTVKLPYWPYNTPRIDNTELTEGTYVLFEMYDGIRPERVYCQPMGGTMKMGDKGAYLVVSQAVLAEVVTDVDG